MTIKKNSINEITSDDDDPTAELEVLSLVTNASQSDANSDTGEYQYDGLGASDQLDDGANDDGTISELKSNLKNRTETVSKLQRDIEQLHAKWVGLETEIRAREDLSEELNNKLEEARKARDQSAAKLEKRDASIKSLKAEAKQRDNDYRSLQASNTELQIKFDQLILTEEKLAASFSDAESNITKLEFDLQQVRDSEKSARDLNEQLRLEVADLRDSFQESKQNVAQLQQHIDGRHADWKVQQETIAEQSESIDQLNNEQNNLRSELEQRRESIEQLNTEVAIRAATIRELRDDAKVIQSELESHRADDTDELKRTLAEQSGQLTSNAMTIKVLRDQFDHAENYADTLRRQLDDVIAETKTKEDTRENLQSSLDDANTQISDLESKLIEENRIVTELRQELGDAREIHEQELRTIRFELGEAQETIALSEEAHDALENEKQVVAGLRKEIDDAQAAHEQELRRIRFELGEAQTSLTETELAREKLAADFFDTQSFRTQLETMLEQKDQEHSKEINSLTRTNRKLAQEIESIEQKLVTKTEAVACLLSEIAKKNEQMQSIHEIEEVIHEIDDRMSDRIDEHAGSDRDRITRVLRGTIDGQKFRFPLFKNRLTIGRTQQNDIQVDAPYISRRHAVIVTDSDTTRIVDLGSKNGVSVNSQPISEQSLRHGDIVTIGAAKFQYEERPKRDLGAH